MTQLGLLWTIDELGARVALALSADYAGPPNGRVRHIPDQRTIRYYTTLGLMDRPAEMRGRTALYGRRHLLQLVAIKRLQARGLSLSAIQQRLLGLGDAALRRLARLPQEAESANGSEPVSQSPPAAPREPFWTAVPTPAPSGDGGSAASDSGTQPAQRAGSAAAGIMQGIRLEDDVTLLVPAIRPVEEDDLQAIRTVAAPLLKLLKTRRLLGQSNHEDIHD
jgi:hypothetical protein